MTVVVNIVSCFLGLLFACSAVSSKSVQLEDQGHLDIRPAHSHHESLAMKNTAVESQYKYQSYHVDDYNGLGFTQPSVIPTRLKGTARKLAVVSKTRNEDQRTEKKNSLYTVIRNGGGTMKNTVNKLRASRKIKHRPFSSSGIQTSLSPHQEKKLLSRDQMDGFKFQKKTTRSPSTSTVRSLGDSSEQQSPKQLGPSSTKEAAKEHETAFEGAKTSPNGHDSQTFSTFRSTTYRSDEADLSDIIGMDYGRVRRMPPIHNSSSP